MGERKYGRKERSRRVIVGKKMNRFAKEPDAIVVDNELLVTYVIISFSLILSLIFSL